MKSFLVLVASIPASPNAPTNEAPVLATSPVLPAAIAPNLKPLAAHPRSPADVDAAAALPIVKPRFLNTESPQNDILPRFEALHHGAFWFSLLLYIFVLLFILFYTPLIQLDTGLSNIFVASFYAKACPSPYNVPNVFANVVAAVPSIPATALPKASQLDWLWYLFEFKVSSVSPAFAKVSCFD